MSDLLHAERQKLVLLEDLVGTESQALKDQTRVALVLKPVQHPHTGTGKKTRAQMTPPKKHFALQVTSLYPRLNVETNRG